MFKSTGKLVYYEDYAIVEVDPGIALFYRSLIPKHISWRPPMHKPHISVVRKGKEPLNKIIYNNEIIEYEYDNYIYLDNKYVWLKAYSSRLEQIRLELGLPRHRFDDCYHITIANFK